jgi:tryptophan synthase alpha chain
MNRIDAAFARLQAEKRAAFIPFIAAGDPDLGATAALIQELDRRGAGLIEVGMPYSDPVADGATIQAAYTRALAGGATIERILQTVAAVRPKVQAPLLSMISISLVYKQGFAAYVERAKAAGIDGAIIPDLPVEEAEAWAATAAAADFPLVLLSAPTTPDPRRRLIARHSRGFIYCVSTTGLTGARDDLPADVLDHVRSLKSLTSTPVCVGFGISRPEQVRQLARVADGVIVGSAIVRLVAANAGAPRDALVRAVGDFAAGLIGATERDVSTT